MLAHILLPSISMMILTVGSSLLTTVTSIDLKTMGLTNLTIGLIATGFFLGIIFGALSSKSFIERVGYIRSYATFAALIACTTLLQGVMFFPSVWFISRFLSGYAFSGLFIIIESWILHGCNNKTKGRILAFYLLLYYLAQAIGQFFLKFQSDNTLTVYCMGSFFASASLIPIAMTNLEAPIVTTNHEFCFKKIITQTPLSLIIAMFAGLILSAIYVIYPLFLYNLNFSHEYIAWTMAATILGGALLQYPIGKFTDIFDRRVVLTYICSALFCLMLLSLLINIEHKLVFLVISFLMGGLSFAIYPISISITSDRVSSADLMSGLAVLTVCYGIGSVIGPTIAIEFITLSKKSGFFLFMLCIPTLLFLYLSKQIQKKDPVIVDEKATFNIAAPAVNILPTDIQPYEKIDEKEENTTEARTLEEETTKSDIIETDIFSDNHDYNGP